MKWLINLISLKPLLYIALRLCILKLLIQNVFAYNNNKAPPPIVRHPGTCTFQQLQDACTFSLLCYLAGGLPIEGCGTGSSTTCCVLQHNPSVQQMLDLSKLANINEHSAQHLADKSANLIQDPVIPPTNLPPSSTTYADTDQSPPIPTGDSALAISKSSPEKESSSSTEASSRNLLTDSNSNKYTNEDATLHSSSSSLSASTNPYDPPYAGYQTHHQIHHSPRSLYPPPISHPSSLQYHHRLQHPYSSIANPHHLSHQKQHQHSLYMHQQRLASHPSVNHHSSLYSSPPPAYHHPSAHPSHYSPPAYHPTPSSNARSFHLARYNNPLLSQYPSNYLLNDNYYGAEPSGYGSVPEQRPAYSEHLSGYGLGDQTDAGGYSSPLSDLSMPPSGAIVPSANAYGNSEPDSSPPYPYNNLNDYSNPSPTNMPPSVPSSSSLLSSYTPTQTIDYKNYQKHSVNPYNAAAELQFPPLYSTSSSTSSFESTTNHSNHHLYNSNKMYSPAAVESPASIKYYNTNHLPKNADYEPSTSYNANVQPDDTPVNSISSDEESPLMIDHNNRLSPAEEDEYNSNAIRRSRLASPMNIAMEQQTQARNFIGEEGCGKPISKPTKRIIGGQDAYYAEFPWMAHVKIAKQQCGGTLINRDFVATAAHCVYQAPLEQLTIIIGAHDIESKNSKYYDEIPQHHEVESVILHPNFRFSAAHPDRFDIALLKLKRRAIYTNTVRPICLPPKNLNNIEGWRGVVTGWGKTESSLANRYGTRLLQKVDVPIINNHECEKWHQTRGIDLKIFSEMMCAGYEDGQKDACVGDSGGPLIVFLNQRWVLAGITSAGFGCAQAQQPGIYHRVSYTVDWIQQILNGSPYK